jgi:hypothetical protein
MLLRSNVRAYLCRANDGINRLNSLRKCESFPTQRVETRGLGEQVKTQVSLRRKSHMSRNDLPGISLAVMERKSINPLRQYPRNDLVKSKRELK